MTFSLSAMRLPAFAAIVLFAMNAMFAQSGYKQTKPLDLANMDTSVEPCTDFFRYSNGGWLDKNPVPAAYSNWGSFSEITERNNEILQTLLLESAAKKDAPKGTSVQIVGDFYVSGMDSAQAEADGLKPLGEEFARIEGMKTLADVQRIITRGHQKFGSTVFAIGSVQDFKNTEDVIVTLNQAGLTLPDRDFYLGDAERYKAIRNEYTQYMIKMFQMLGDNKPTAEKNAATVLKMETRLAKASMKREDLRSPEKQYNKMSIAQLKRLAPAFGWDRYLTDMNVNVKSLNVGQPNFIREVNAMLKSVPVADWKTYLRWQMIDGTAQYLNSDFENTHFAFHGTVLNGQKELKPRWKRVLQTIDGLTGDALGQMYVAKAFPPEAKERALRMVKNLLAAFTERVDGLDWMSAATKKKAKEKANSFALKIGYTDKWKNYDGLNINNGPYVLNVLRASEFEVRRQLAQVGQPVDRTEWGMTPSTVNAYYNPLLNEIVFPAGILQPPFFDPNADDAVNYGGMGAVIGHEISHGFDDEGRKFDAKGNLTDWWTKEDAMKFEKKAKMVEEQFSNYVVIDSLKLNGKFTLGENIADLGGLAIAYHAFQKTLAAKPMLSTIDGLTPPQRFFLAWGQMWRRNYTAANLKQRIDTDPHSPSRFRSNGPLSNMPQFFEAFGCKSNDSMMRPADMQVKIW